MVDHDRMAAAFARVDLDVNRADPVRLAGTQMSAGVRRVLTEIGLPEELGEHVSFDNLRDGGVVMKAIDAGKPRAGDSLLHIGFGLNDTGIYVDGLSGEVFARQNGELRRISPTLESFVNFLYLMEVMMNEAEEHDWSSPDEVAEMRRTMAKRLAGADSEAMAEAGDYWRDVFQYSM